MRQVTSSLSYWGEGENEKKESLGKRNLSLILMLGSITVIFFFFFVLFCPEPVLTAASLSSFSIVNKVFLGL